MTSEEIEQLAQRVAANIIREASIPISSAGTTTSGAEDATCFTCSGTFRCRRSFMIQMQSPDS